MDHCGRCDMVSGARRKICSLTRTQLLANCLQPLVFIAGPDLELVKHHKRCFAIGMHAAEPTAIVKRLPPLLGTNAVMLTDLHWTAATRTRTDFISCDDDEAHHVTP